MSCLVVAEVAQAHDGSLGTALAYIDAAAKAGADAIKFQTHLAEAESTPAEPWRVPFSPQDASRYAYWQRMEFPESGWLALRRRADEVGIGFLSSPFSLEAVALLERVGVLAWKVASGEVGTPGLLRRLAGSGRPVWLSTGMSSQAEVDAAVALLLEAGADVTVLQCTSRYPTPPEDIGLNLLGSWRDRYPGCGVGLSDHSGTIYPGLAAAALGADLVEVHVCFSRDQFGPDVPASVTFAELADLVRGVRFLERARANPVDKDRTAQDLAPMRELFTKSVVARADLPAGTVLEADHLTTKKPGTGIPAKDLPSLVGRVLARDVRADQLLAPADLG